MEERLAGSQTQTQSAQQVNTGVESGVNENTESVEGVDTSFDFNAWKQEILEEAKLAGQDVQILTRSELDSLIAKALKTREENLKKQQLQKSGEYEKLLRTERAEALTELVNVELSKYGLEEFTSLINVDKLTEHPLSEAKELIKEQIEHIKDTVQRNIQKRLEEELKKIEADTFASKKKTVDLQDVRNMTYEELEKLYSKNT